MTQSFFELSETSRSAYILAQSRIIQNNALNMPTTPAALEKDIWICWTLDKLSNFNSKYDMAFKGGTSLSKTFGGIINRFSEDVDIAFDCRQLAEARNIDLAGLTDKGLNHRQEKGKQLSKFAAKYVIDEIVPYLRTELAKDLEYYMPNTAEKSAIEPLEMQGRQRELQVEFRYPKLFSGSEIMLPSIKLEFAGHSELRQIEAQTIVPYVYQAAGVQPDINTPGIAFINTVQPVRTFCDKLMAIHKNCRMYTSEYCQKQISESG